MHPSELKNQALVAATQARLEGFTATAEAFLLIASACSIEAQDLQLNLSKTNEHKVRNATLDRVRVIEVIH
jgi:rubrerythrin